MWRGSCSRRSSASRPRTSCASSRRTSAAASARRSSSMPKRPSASGRRKKIDRPVKWTCDRTEAFLSDAHGRDHVTHAELALDASGKITGLRVHTIANLGAYMSTFASLVPTYLYAPLLSGQYDIPNIYCEVDAVYTNTAPVDAYRGAGRPEATFVVERLVEVAARETGRDPARIPPHELRHRRSRIRRRSIMTYDAGDYRRRARQGAGARRLQGRRRAQGGLGGEGQAARHRLFRLYRGLRHRAVARRSARSAAAWGCGNRRKCGSIRSAPSRS